MQSGALIITANTAQSIIAGLMRNEVSPNKKAFMQACVQTHKQVANSHQS